MGLSKRREPRVFRAGWCRRATVSPWRERGEVERPHFHVVVGFAVYCVDGAAGVEAKLQELRHERRQAAMRKRKRAAS